MEVSLDAGKIPNLIEFVSHLTERMHSSVPGSLVIWWESDSSYKLLMFLGHNVQAKIYTELITVGYAGTIVSQSMVHLAGKINWMKKTNPSLMFVMEFL